MTKEIWNSEVKGALEVNTFHSCKRIFTNQDFRLITSCIQSRPHHIEYYSIYQLYFEGVFSKIKIVLIF